MEATLQQLIEAVLFYKGEPMKIKDLAKAVQFPEERVQATLDELKNSLRGRGVTLVLEGEYAGLATAAEARNAIEAIRKEELEGPLGKAGLETLSIIMYHGPLSRAEIEYIRGVNSSSILRSLLMRGLIEKRDNPKDKRSYLYQGTPELSATLGLSALSEAPEFEKIKSDIDAILQQKEQEEVSEPHHV